jgi:predicted esterase
MPPRKLRVQFVHGLESSPQGEKARLFAQHFDALTPAMDTSDFEACVGLQAGTLARFQPEVLVGSSFGGAVVVALLQRKLWRGPTVLLAQASLHYDPEVRLPPGVPVTLVHGLQDEIVPFEHSRRLAASAPESTTVLEFEDDHRLSYLQSSGKLIEIVRAAVSAG